MFHVKNSILDMQISVKICWLLCRMVVAYIWLHFSVYKFEFLVLMLNEQSRNVNN